MMVCDYCGKLIYAVLPNHGWEGAPHDRGFCGMGYFRKATPEQAAAHRLGGDNALRLLVVANRKRCGA